MYQPMVAMQRRTGERFEAVLRLRARDGEMIPPFDFLPVAAQFGLMPSIDRWVLTRALDDIKTYRTHRPALSLMVRQTMATLAADDWIDWVREGIASRDLIQHRPMLMFEVADVAANLDLAKKRFDELQRLRIDLCLNQMDDSPQPPGRSSDLSVGRWCGCTARSSHSQTAALKTLIVAIHLRGAQVIATGIEDPQAIARAWDCGVDFIQGNFIQAPRGWAGVRLRRKRTDLTGLGFARPTGDRPDPLEPLVRPLADDGKPPSCHRQCIRPIERDQAAAGNRPASSVSILARVRAAGPAPSRSARIRYRVSTRVLPWARGRGTSSPAASSSRTWSTTCILNHGAHP